MSPKLDPEETAALRELLGGGSASEPPQVEARDFAEPKRLSTVPAEAHLAPHGGRRLNELCADLAGSLRRYPKLSVEQVSEMSAHNALP